MELVIDKTGNLKSWKIVYCGWSTPTNLVDENEPFKTAYVSAHTAEDAIRSLKEELRLAKIDVYGKPQLELISREDYEDG